MENNFNDTAAQNVPVYDADAVQTIPLILRHGSRSIEASIEMNPVSDDEWFTLVESIPEHARRIKAVSVELFAPFGNLGRIKAVKQHNYQPRDDWRSATPTEHFIQMINAYLEVRAADDEEENATFSFDDDAPQKMIAAQNGQEIETTVFFRSPTADQKDEYIAASTGEPMKNALASAKKVSKERRLFALYEQLQTRNENYAGRVPAWHAVAAVQAFMESSIGNMGKLLRG